MLIVFFSDAFIRDLVDRPNVDPRDRQETWNMWSTGPGPLIDGLGRNERIVRTVQTQGYGRNTRIPQEERTCQDVLTEMRRL